MSIRIKGAKNRAFPPAVVLQKAIELRLKDAKYGIPLQIIYLDWNDRKQNFHQAKTHGNFDDLFVIRTEKGLQVEYRTPGSLEWLKDGLTGRYSAMCPVTPNNLGMLASCYYDDLWTIRDPVIDAKAREIADRIDEENKKIPQDFVKIVKELDPVTGFYRSVEKRVHGTMYDYHAYRRSIAHKGAADAVMLSPVEKSMEAINLQKELQEVAKKRKELDERERQIKEREKKTGISVNVLPPEQAPPEIAPLEKETLDHLHIGKLRKIARDQYGIEDAFKKTKSQLIPELLAIQNSGKAAEDPADVSEESQETLPLSPAIPADIGGSPVGVEQEQVVN